MRRSPRPSAILAVTLWAHVALQPAPASAEWECPRGGSPADVEANASAAFDEGERLFREGDFERARERFRCSYELFPHRATLYNVAQCLERLGNLDEAIDLYHEYLEISPDSEERAEVEAHVRELVASVDTRSEPPDTTEGQPPTAGTETRADETEETRTRSRRRLRPVWFWALLGATVGTSVIMTATGVSTLRLADRWIEEGNLNDRDQALALRSTTDAFLILSICEAVATLVVGLFTDFGPRGGGEPDAQR
jgi:tetratricopeptide (TPR) repeat protein